ncbi:hypothetical protein [Brevibacillus laterosporus]|uniref:hypothetical protein n=1 Tax=Brevibacillus laterosporus TaxID=1465 RepID=UPI003D1A7547
MTEKVVEKATATIPAISFDYDLAAIATNIGSVFTSIWPILALLGGIALAFRFSGEILAFFKG